jgi:HEAT repeat protein
MGLFGPPDIGKLVDSLKTITSQEVVEYLIAKKKDPPAAVRKLIKAGSLAVPRLTAAVEEGIPSRDAMLLVNAAFALLRIPDRSVAVPLAKLLAGDFYAVVSGNLDVEGQTITTLADPFKCLYEETVSVLLAYRDETIVGAVRELAGDRSKVNSGPYAVRFLGQLQDASDIPFFMGMLAEEGFESALEFRAEAMKALQGFRSKDARRSIAERFKALGPAGLQQLTRGLEASDPSVRLWALETLQHVPHRGMSPVLALATQDDDADVAKKAWEILEKHASRENFTRTRSILTEYAKKYWCYSEQNSHPPGLLQIDDIPLRNTLIFLRCRDSEIGERAFKDIRSFEPDIRGVLRRFFARESRLKNSRKVVKSIGKAYEEATWVQLGEDLFNVRSDNKIFLKIRSVEHFEVVAERLALLGGDVSIQALAEALDDYDTVNRTRAVRSLGKIGDDKAIDPLVRAYFRPQAEGSGIMPDIVSAIERIGSKAALAALERIAKDSLTELFHQTNRVRKAIESVKRGPRHKGRSEG